jgi:RND superfamily putative drug exporter
MVTDLTERITSRLPWFIAAIVAMSFLLLLMMFAILFGLSMDDEVFLLSRVREEYVRTGDSHGSVVNGLSSTARVITSAALIMISVFGRSSSVTTRRASCSVSDSPSRCSSTPPSCMVLVPATMSLVGRANWWLPGWLDRILPHLDLEGRPGAGDRGAGPGDGDVPTAEPAAELLPA